MSAATVHPLDDDEEDECVEVINDDGAAAVVVVDDTYITLQLLGIDAGVPITGERADPYHQVMGEPVANGPAGVTLSRQLPLRSAATARNLTCVLQSNVLGVTVQVPWDWYEHPQTP
jgi:hypothetical protein